MEGIIVSQALITPPPANLGELPRFGEELRRHGTGTTVEVHSICFTRECVLCINGTEIPINKLDDWYNLSRPAVEWTTVSSDHFP